MLLAPIAALLNRSIADSTVARARCQQLQGKVLVVRVTGPDISIYARCEQGKLELLTRYDGEPHASLAGSPAALIGLVRPQPESAVRSGSVRIEGDAEVAQGFQQLFKAARPDLEEELSRLVGDVAAHQIGKVARGWLNFTQRAVRTFGQNVSEYLQEESRDVPARIEVDEFVAAVDTLRNDVDRIEARLELLENGVRRTMDSAS